MELLVVFLIRLSEKGEEKEVVSQVVIMFANGKVNDVSEFWLMFNK